MASGPADETTKAHVESALKALQAVQRPESTGGDVKAQARSLLQDMTTTLNEHETKKFEEKTGSRAMAEFSVAFMRGIEAVNLGKHAFDNDKISNKKKEWQCNACHVLPAPGKQLRTCSGCHARHYCSTECARRAWGGHAGHKVECTATKAMRRCVEEGMGGLSEEAISRVRSEVFQKCEKELTKQVAVENEAKAESERRQAATQQGPAALSLFDLRRSAAWENAFNAFVVPKDFASFDPAKPQSEAFLAQFDSAAARAEGMPSRAKAEKSFEKLAAKANPKKKGKGKKNKAAKGASGGGGGDVDDADADGGDVDGKGGGGFDHKDFFRYQWQERLEQCPLHQCVGEENAEALELFLAAGENVDSLADPKSRGNTPLYCATQHADRRVRDHGAALLLGTTPPSSAAKPPYLGAMRTLLKAGAKVDCAAPCPLGGGGGGGGCPPIWQAVFQSPPEAVAVLLEAGGGATANLPGSLAGMSHTLLMDALVRVHNGRRDNATIAKLLIKAGADVNATATTPLQETALHSTVTTYAELVINNEAQWLRTEYLDSVLYELVKVGADLGQGQKGQPGNLPLAVGAAALLRGVRPTSTTTGAPNPVFRVRLKALVLLLEAALAGVRKRLTAQRLRLQQHRQQSDAVAVVLGDLVKLHGLQAAAHLNGELAWVVGGGGGRGGSSGKGAPSATGAVESIRWTVRLLSTGRCVNIKPANLVEDDIGVAGHGGDDGTASVERGECGKIGLMEWRRAGEPKAALWTKGPEDTSQQSFMPFTGADKDAQVCLGFVLFHLARCPPAAQGSLDSEGALLEALVTQYDADQPARTAFLASMSHGDYEAATQYYFSVGAKSMATAKPWLSSL